jgi:hypothetical protein
MMFNSLLRKLARAAVHEFPEAEAHRENVSCGKKLRYSEERAVEAAERLGKGTPNGMAAYQCEFCRDWHIGRRKPR